MSDERYQRGLRRLEELDGQAGLDWLEDLATVSPDLARLTVEFPFGDVWSRSGLSDRDREIATIAALTALGNAKPELRSHMALGLKIGLSQAEILEIIIQMSVYAGFPAALNALAAAKDVFADAKGTTDEK